MVQKSTKQFEILQYIYDVQKQRGYPPTIREIGEKVALASSSTVHGHLIRLQKRGFIDKTAEKTRAISITSTGLSFLQHHTLTNDTIQPKVKENISLLDLIPTDEADVFVLKHHGNTMINIGILNNDYLIVKRQTTAIDGDIVVIQTNDNDELHKQVYRYFKENDHFRLQPENNNLKSIITTDIQIVGRVIGLYRDEIN